MTSYIDYPRTDCLSNRTRCALDNAIEQYVKARIEDSNNKKFGITSMRALNKVHEAIFDHEMSYMDKYIKGVNNGLD